jgi:hypothetical protein
MASWTDGRLTKDGHTLSDEEYKKETFGKLKN